MLSIVAMVLNFSISRVLIIKLGQAFVILGSHMIVSIVFFPIAIMILFNRFVAAQVQPKALPLMNSSTELQFAKIWDKCAKKKYLRTVLSNWVSNKTRSFKKLGYRLATSATSKSKHNLRAMESLLAARTRIVSSPFLKLTRRSTPSTTHLWLTSSGMTKVWSTTNPGSTTTLRFTMTNGSRLHLSTPSLELNPMKSPSQENLPANNSGSGLMPEDGLKYSYWSLSASLLFVEKRILSLRRKKKM